MRKTPATTLAGAVTLVALGALTSYALRPVESVRTPAPPVEVRTQVVRRTVWIVKHEKPAQPQHPRTPAAGAPPQHGAAGTARSGGRAAAGQVAAGRGGSGAIAVAS